MHQTKNALISFGLTVKHYRESLGLSQEILAEKTGLHRTYISGIERGIRNPSLKNVAKISQALNIPLKDLFKDVSNEL